MSTPNIARAREQIIYVVPETTKGQLAFPSDVDAQLVIGAGAPEMNQKPSYTDSDEVRDTLDITDRFADKKPAGSWSIPTYLRPAGSAGQKPMGHDLFKALMGTETVNPGASVVYSQAKEKPSLSIWMKLGHTVFFGQGCAVNEAELDAAVKGAVKVNFKGGLMNMGWAGTASLATAINGAGVTSVVVDDASRFTVGARVYNASKGYHNSQAGWTVTAVNTTTDTLTVTPAIDGSVNDWDVADEVAGYLPSGGTVIGAPLESQLNTVAIGGAEVRLKSMKLKMGSPVKYIEDEIGGDYPEDYLEQARDITVSLEAYFRKALLSYFADASSGGTKAVSLTCGTAAGSRAVFSAPYVSLEMPEAKVSAPAVALSLNGKALGSVGEDSLTITFN